jgi:hypothetical protein
MTHVAIFTKWCLDPKGRTPVAVNPKRVDCVQFEMEAFPGIESSDKEPYPAASRIIMQGKQEYLVMGTVEDVAAMLEPGAD